jgi:aminomethyltransferase
MINFPDIFLYNTHRIYGKDALDFVEKLVVGDVRGKQVNEGFLSLILNKQAGIIDDTIVTKMSDHM